MTFTEGWRASCLKAVLDKYLKACCAPRPREILGITLGLQHDLANFLQNKRHQSAIATGTAGTCRTLHEDEGGSGIVLEQQNCRLQPNTNVTGIRKLHEPASETSMAAHWTAHAIQQSWATCSTFFSTSTGALCTRRILRCVPVWKPSGGSRGACGWHVNSPFDTSILLTATKRLFVHEAVSGLRDFVCRSIWTNHAVSSSPCNHKISTLSRGWSGIPFALVTRE